MLFNAVFIRWQKFKERIFHLCYRRITTQRGGIQTAPDPDAVNQYAKLPSRFLGIFLVEKMFQFMAQVTVNAGITDCLYALALFAMRDFCSQRYPSLADPSIIYRLREIGDNDRPQSFYRRICMAI